MHPHRVSWPKARNGFSAVRRGILAGEHPIEHRRVTIVPNPSLKNEKLYRDLREQGNSEEKSARISNAVAARGKSAVGRKGGKAGSYTDWTVPELKKRAKEIGLSGYSGLSKKQLVSKLRNS